jgi:phosphate transport system protein
MPDHIVRAFDADLELLNRSVAEMGGLAEKMTGLSIEALTRRSPKLANEVIALDPSLDTLQRDLEEKAVLTIAKRQPVAVDLRMIVAAIRIAGDLERIGDLAKNTAKRVIAIVGQMNAPKVVGGVEHMSTLAMRQLKDVLDAYLAKDVAKALDVWRRDDEIDALYTSLFRELLTYMMEDPRNIGFCTHLLFCAKNVERIGDHTTNIAETVHFLVTGSPLAIERPKADTSSLETIELDN